MNKRRNETADPHRLPQTWHTNLQPCWCLTWWVGVLDDGCPVFLRLLLEATKQKWNNVRTKVSCMNRLSSLWCSLLPYWDTGSQTLCRRPDHLFGFLKDEVHQRAPTNISCSSHVYIKPDPELLMGFFFFLSLQHVQWGHNDTRRITATQDTMCSYCTWCLLNVKTDMKSSVSLPLGAGRFIPLMITTTMSVLLSSGNILEGWQKNEDSKNREKKIHSQDAFKRYAEPFSNNKMFIFTF